MPPSFTVAFMSHMSGRSARYATPREQEFRPLPQVYVAESGLFSSPNLRGFLRVTPQNKRSEEHTSELQSLMRISYAVFCLKKQQKKYIKNHTRARPTTTNKNNCTTLQ